MLAEPASRRAAQAATEALTCRKSASTEAAQGACCWAAEQLQSALLRAEAAEAEPEPEPEPAAEQAAAPGSSG